jgi:apolipoprotein N-acyltransferase
VYLMHVSSNPCGSHKPAHTAMLLNETSPSLSPTRCATLSLNIHCILLPRLLSIECLNLIRYYLSFYFGFTDSLCATTWLHRFLFTANLMFCVQFPVLMSFCSAVTKTLCYIIVNVPSRFFVSEYLSRVYRSV